MGLFIILMEVYMKVNLKMIKLKISEYINILMEINMNANLKILVEKDIENFITIKEIDMKVTLLMEIILATEYIILL